MKKPKKKYASNFSKHKEKSADPVRAKKHLGQHFLKDEDVAEKIGDTLTLQGYDRVLEIGPGTGVLTKYLLQKKVEVSVLELDRDSVAYLKEDFRLDHPAISSVENFTIIEGDFLKMDFAEFHQGKQLAITGNFPYNISSQIVFKAIENREWVPEFTGMFQKEVARRICEKPGTKTYGILSVLVQAFFEAEYLFSVSPEVFSPPPKVDSGVLRLIRRADYSLPVDEKLFFKVVKTAFQQRRKTLRNSLKTFELSDDLKADPLFAERPEQLSVAGFIELTQKLIADEFSD